jgi:hypothetical protein
VGIIVGWIGMGFSENDRFRLSILLDNFCDLIANTRFDDASVCTDKWFSTPSTLICLPISRWAPIPINVTVGI